MERFYKKNKVNISKEKGTSTINAGKCLWGLLWEPNKTKLIAKKM